MAQTRTIGRAPQSFQCEEDKNLAAEFDLWLEDFESYCELQEVKLSSQKRQLLLNLGGLDIRRAVKGLEIGNSLDPAEEGGERDVYTPVKTALKRYFKPSVNITTERHIFRARKQLEGESVIAYVGTLRALAAKCQFDETTVDSIVNCLIRDQLIEGLRSGSIRRELLAISSLTLADAVAKAVGLETAEKNARMYDAAVAVNGAVTPASECAVVARHPGRSEPSRLAEAPGGSTGDRCRYCGGRHRLERRFCPAVNAKCYKCQKNGHFARMCRQQRQPVANTIAEDMTAEVSEDVTVVYGLGPRHHRLGNHDPRFWITLKVNGKLTQGLLDTRAVGTVLPITVAKPTRKSDRSLRAYGGKEIETLGRAVVSFSAPNGAEAKCDCYIVKAGHATLFGQDVIEALGLVSLKAGLQICVVDMPPVQLAVRSDARPVAASSRRHAFSIRKEIEAELKRMQAADIIEPVRGLTPWVSPIVPCRKADGRLRICIDYRELNKHIIRERRVMPTADEILAQIHGSTVFSVLDAEAGFHQIPLSYESRHLTAFICHSGVYRFKRLPFGVVSAPEIFQRVMSELLVEIPGVFVYIDDILVTGKDVEEHDDRLKQVTDKMKSVHLKLNEKKCQLRKQEVRYLGCIINAEGVQPDPRKIEAIRDMQEPKSIKDIRRFLGMLTYLSKFLPGLADLTATLRQLSNRKPFVADDELIAAFRQLRQAIAERFQKLCFYDVSPERPTSISVDASPLGLGAILWQKRDNDEWCPVACASRSLSDTESRYSQLEREMLAVVFGIVKFRQFVLGRDITVLTDHKPLVNIVQKSFDCVPARVQRWLVALLPYSFTLEHRPGVTMLLADTLSRAPLKNIPAAAEETRSMKEFVGLVLTEAPVSVEDLKKATDVDPVLGLLRTRILSGSWSKLSEAEDVYFKARPFLTVADGVIMYDNRVVVPQSLQTSVLRLAHEGHPGLDTFLDNLRRTVWWPHLTRDATRFATACEICWQMRSNPNQMLQPSDIVPVWHTVAVDLVEIESRHLLSLIDYGSRYPELLPLTQTTSGAVIDALAGIFSRFGFPRELVSDNGPQFVSEKFRRFLKMADIKHIRCSPRYPSSNGMVERFHATVRRRMTRLGQHHSYRDRLQQTLLFIRTTVNRMIGIPPGEAFLGRPLRNRLPMKVESPIVGIEQQIKTKLQMSDQHDKKRGVGDLPDLSPGSAVMLRDGYTPPFKEWTVVRQEGQQVIVSDGVRTAFRNRQQVRAMNPPQRDYIVQSQDAQTGRMNLDNSSLNSGLQDTLYSKNSILERSKESDQLSPRIEEDRREKEKELNLTAKSDGSGEERETLQSKDLVPKLREPVIKLTRLPVDKLMLQKAAEQIKDNKD